MKKFLLSLLTAVFIFTLAGCSNESKKNDGYKFIDSLKNEITVNGSEKTAVLSGSLAEIWYLAGGELAGVTADAYEGHGFTVPETAKNYGSMKTPSVEQMTADKIEFAILSSVSEDHVALKKTLEDVGIKTAYFEVETFDDYLNMLKICTEITGRKDLYEKNGTEIEKEVNLAKGNAKKLTEGKKAPSVLLLRAYSSGVKSKGSDNMTGVMLKDLGCENIADKTPSLLEDISVEQIVLEDPDYIFITTMGDENKGVAKYNELFANNPAWSGLSAVKNNKVHILPQDLYHYKPNTRWGEAYKNLAEIIYG